jgi:hypothetical protein
VVLVVIALAVVTTLGDAASSARPSLTVIVRGHGTVVVAPGAHRCSRRCRRQLARGTVITLRAAPAAGRYFGGWSGACAARVTLRCSFRLTASRVVTAPFAARSPLASWNPAYTCKPTLTTIPFILGSQESALGGATEIGGGFQPHLRGGAQQHLVHPPCSIRGTGTLVEIHDVELAENPDHSVDGDETANVMDANRPDIKDVYMKTIHTEIDALLRKAGIAPPIQPPKGTMIDIQGFVFWDPAHTTAQWHSFSGWELHTVTAWRRAKVIDHSGG